MKSICIYCGSSPGTNPAFLAEAEKQRVDIDPMTGAEMDKMFKEAYATPPEIVERTKVLLKRAGAI